MLTAHATDSVIDNRATRPRRGRQPGIDGGGGCTKRFPQFPPGASAAAAKAARAGDTAEKQSLSLPVLSNYSSATTTPVNDALISPSFALSGRQQLSPRDGCE